MENKIKHLEMIQGVITRMANCSFALKGWAVVLMSALFALASKETNQTYFLFAFVPIIFFWCLDSFYLYQEGMYISLYNKVRKLDDSSIDFNMNTKDKEFQKELKKETKNYLKCFISKTEILFYLPLLALCLVVFCYNKNTTTASALLSMII